MKVKHNCSYCIDRSKEYIIKSEWYANRDKYRYRLYANWSKWCADKCQCNKKVV